MNEIIKFCDLNNEDNELIERFENYADYTSNKTFANDIISDLRKMDEVVALKELMFKQNSFFDYCSQIRNQQ